MGQRSQIYVKIDNKLVIANYYQWNYGERMISRARYGIEYMKSAINRDSMYLFKDSYWLKKVSRIFDTNFDYKDVAISSNILDDYINYGEGQTLPEYVFHEDNNDGMLFVSVDTDKKQIKYALTDCEGNLPLNPGQYMQWEEESLVEPWVEILDKEEYQTYLDNAAYIENNAQLMTANDIVAFKNL